MAGRKNLTLVVPDPEQAAVAIAASRERREERTRVAIARVTHNAATRNVPLTKQAREAVLTLISAGMKISDACQRVGVSERTVYYHRQTDTAFAADWDQAMEASCEPIEDSLLEVIHDGDVNSMARVKAAEIMLASRNRRYRRDNQNARAVLTQREADGTTKSFAISTGDYIPS